MTNTPPTTTPAATRAALLTILAFEARVITLKQACQALKCTPRELIDLESYLIGQGRDLAVEA